MSCSDGCRCGIDRNCPGYGNSIPKAVVANMTFTVNTSSGIIDTLVRTTGDPLDPLDILYAYSLLCTGITEVQAVELNEAHTKARQRVKTLRETIQSIIDAPETTSAVKEQLTKILKEV